VLAILALVAPASAETSAAAFPAIPARSAIGTGSAKALAARRTALAERATAGAGALAFTTGTVVIPAWAGTATFAPRGAWPATSFASVGAVAAALVVGVGFRGSGFLGPGWQEKLLQI
jgi:hypothetical protein